MVVPKYGRCKVPVEISQPTSSRDLILYSNPRHLLLQSPAAESRSNLPSFVEKKEIKAHRMRTQKGV